MADVRCNRCHGLYVQHQLHDGNIRINRAIRCVNCGNVVDPTILTMKQQQATYQPPKENTRVHCGQRW